MNLNVVIVRFELNILVFNFLNQRLLEMGDVADGLKFDLMKEPKATLACAFLTNSPAGRP